MRSVLYVLSFALLARAQGDARPDVATLLGALDDEPAYVRQEAGRALVRRKPGPEHVAAMAARLGAVPDDTAPLLAQALAAAGEAAVDPVVERLADDKARAHAILALEAIGPAAGAAVPALLAYAEDPRAAEALRRIGPWTPTGEIAGVLRRAADPSPPVREAASRVLSGLGPDAVEALAKLPLRNPNLAEATAPERFSVRFETTAGDFTVEIHRAWAPLGADRFYNLARIGYFDGVRFFRVVPGFVAQFGMHGDTRVNAAWSRASLQDDPVRESNTKGRLTFAMAGKDTRSNQLFINLKDNARLDGMGFAPIGEVVEGMHVVERIHSGYGEKPDQGAIRTFGEDYFVENFPELDRVKRAVVLEP